MQDELDHPDTPRVETPWPGLEASFHVVWTPMLPGDSKAAFREARGEPQLEVLRRSFQRDLGTVSALPEALAADAAALRIEGMQAVAWDYAQDIVHVA